MVIQALQVELVLLQQALQVELVHLL